MNETQKAINEDYEAKAQREQRAAARLASEKNSKKDEQETEESEVQMVVREGPMTLEEYKDELERALTDLLDPEEAEEDEQAIAAIADTADTSSAIMPVQPKPVVEYKGKRSARATQGTGKGKGKGKDRNDKVKGKGKKVRKVKGGDPGDHRDDSDNEHFAPPVSADPYMPHVSKISLKIEMS